MFFAIWHIHNGIVASPRRLKRWKVQPEPVAVPNISCGGGGATTQEPRILSDLIRVFMLRRGRRCNVAYKLLLNGRFKVN